MVRPAPDRGALAPAFASRNAPVPKVHLASPGLRQPSASSAACWSTISPPTAAGAPNAAVVADHLVAADDARQVGRRAARTDRPARRPRRPRRGRAAASGWRSTASVTNSPVSWCSSQVSLVVTTPGASPRPRCAAARSSSAPRSTGRAPARSGPRSRRGAARARRRSRPTARPARRSPADSGSPVARSQASTVSPWLASATASIATPAASIAARPAASTDSSSSAGSCSTPPSAR